MLMIDIAYATCFATLWLRDAFTLMLLRAAFFAACRFDACRHAFAYFACRRCRHCYAAFSFFATPFFALMPPFQDTITRHIRIRYC